MFYDQEIRVPKLSVSGCETRSFTWNPTVGSFVVATFQKQGIKGVRKLRFWVHRPSATWRVQVAATSFDALRARVAEVVAEHELVSAR